MKNKLNQPIEETTKWSPHQGICSVKECLWNGRRHPEESNQPIEEKWRENFRDRFGDTFNLCVDDETLQGAIESFIENLLEQERKRMSDEIEKLRPETCECVGATYECEHWGIHETIDKAKAIINK